jgi:outer membrane protein insertion porin family
MHIDEGEQYRLQDILFVNNQQFDSGQLRELFSISAGDLFNTHTIQEGLEKLRKLYGTRGFINLTAAPQVQVDETSGLISLTIDLEEGQQFRISEVTIKGDEGELKRFLRKRKVEPGQVFDGSFTEYMLISANVERKIDEKNATVALSIEILSPCAPPSDITL